MPDQHDTPKEGSVPRIVPKPPSPPFFDNFERHLLGFDLYLLVAAVIGGGLLAIIGTIVKSIKW